MNSKKQQKWKKNLKDRDSRRPSVRFSQEAVDKYLARKREVEEAKNPKHRTTYLIISKSGKGVSSHATADLAKSFMVKEYHSNIVAITTDNDGKLVKTEDVS